MKRSNAPTVPLLLLALLLGACGGDGPGAQQGRGEQPPAVVTVTPVTTESLSLTREYTGRVSGFRTIEVRARVEGILEERLYDEGESVEAGDPLFRIDQRPLQIALDNARANAANARANLEQAEREWQRIDRLYERNAVSERERDRADTAVQLAEAGMAAARAAVDETELNLEYSEVVAPIRGVTGQEAVSEGTLLGYGDLLTDITQLDPVRIHFSVPANEADRARRHHGGDDAITVTAILPDGSEYARPGTVEFMDSTIDPDTNTLAMRATFPNADSRLLPGRILRIRLALDEYRDVAVIEPTALSQGPEGPRVFLRDGSTARSVIVTPGPVIDGHQIILDGIGEGDPLITNGHVMLRDGGEIRPRPEQSGGS